MINRNESRLIAQDRRNQTSQRGQKAANNRGARHETRKDGAEHTAARVKI